MVDAWNLTILDAVPATVETANGWGQTELLLTSQPGERASMPAGADACVLDLGASVSVRQIALLYTTLEEGDTIRLTASDNADGITGAVLDSGVMELDEVALARPSGYRHFFYHRVAGSKKARYVRVASNVAATRYAGRLMAGDPWQPENNAIFGETSWGYEEADQDEVLDSGVSVLYEMDPAPIFQFTLDWITEEELNDRADLLSRRQWEGVPVMVMRRPDPHTNLHNALYYGLLKMAPVVAVDFDTFSVSCSVRSML